MKPTIAETDSAAEIKNPETPSAFQGAPEALDYGTTGKLFDEVRDFFARHPGLPTDAVLKLTYFIFAILFAECAEICPLASVVAPEPAGSSLLLRMIALACPGSLQIGEVTFSAVLTLPLLPRPTLLLIDQLSPTKELERVLRIMSRPGSRILRNGTLSDVFFPTLVCTAEPLRDRWLLDQAIHVALTPVRGPLPKLDATSLHESADQLRGKLARYRDLNFVKVRDSNFDAPHFSSPMREFASMLGNAIVDDPSLQKCVPMILEAQDQEVRVPRTDSIDAVVSEAALFLSHEGARRQARVAEIATIANGILRGRGESLALDPREIGNHLRAIGLFSQRLGRAGRGIRFTNEIRRNIHRLALAYDVRTGLENSTCEFCAEVVRRDGDTPRQEN